MIDLACTSVSLPTGFRRRVHVSTLDIAKRLIDYGFHPPTIYFPLGGQGSADDGADGDGE